MFKILLAILILIPTNGWCVTNWNKALPLVGDNLTSWPAAVVAQWSILDTLLSNYRRAETLTYKNTTTITVAAGEVVVSNSGATLRIFLQDAGSTDITSANLDTGGSFSNSTTYYVYAGATSSTAASSTYYISLSSSAPTGPTYYVQLGSFTTDGSANIVPGSILNNNSLIFLTTQNSIYNMGTRTIANGFLGQTTTGAVSTPGAGSYSVPVGCYMTGITKDGAGLPNSILYACP